MVRSKKHLLIDTLQVVPSRFNHELYLGASTFTCCGLAPYRRIPCLKLMPSHPKRCLAFQASIIKHQCTCANIDGSELLLANKKINKKTRPSLPLSNKKLTKKTLPSLPTTNLVYVICMSTAGPIYAGYISMYIHTP